MTTSLNYPGSRWWKFDFHTHTPASDDWARHKAGTIGPRDWLLKWMAAKIDCVAVTDHNSGAWVDKLKAAYEELEASAPDGFRELVLFPGVEISVHGGIHLLAIFDPSASGSDIDGLLGAVGYTGTKGDTDGVSEKSLIEVLKAVHKAGGIPIPAHADRDKGLLQLKAGGRASADRDATTLRQVCKPKLIIAAEVVDPKAIKPTVYKESSCHWTEVLGSDCHSFEGQRVPGSRFTWIKMGSPSIEGLRFALLDGPRFSVRRSDAPETFDPEQLPEHFIEAIDVADARYMGRGQATQLRFSPWFNAIVGGRGTGKSTLVHALRLAYRREHELLKDSPNSDAARVFKAFCPQGRSAGGGLTASTEILVTLSRDTKRYRLRWRHDGKNDAVEVSTGTDAWTASSDQSVSPQRFPLRIYSQGQIAALSGTDGGALLALVDEVATDCYAAKQTLAEARQGFLTLRNEGRALKVRLKARADVSTKLDDVKRKLAGFEGQQHAATLKRYQVEIRQERELNHQFEGAHERSRKIETLAKTLVVDDVRDELFCAKDEPTACALKALAQVRQAIALATNELQATANNLDKRLSHIHSELEDSTWRRAVENTKVEYETLITTLRDQGVSDPSEYGKLVQEQQRLEKQLAAFDSLKTQLARNEDDAHKQRLAVQTQRRQLSTLRQNYLNATLASNNYVRISLVRYGNTARAIDRSLRAVLNLDPDKFKGDILTMEEDESTAGLVHDLLDGLPQGNAGPQESESRVDKWRSRFTDAAAGRGDFSGHFNNYLERECGNNPALLDQLLMYSPDDELAVQYSRKGDGKNFRPIEQASAGQQAAAMLAFLLADGTEPIVLDQPEDDLDNQLIYDLIVRQIRENKLRRQLIVVTHNPNIVVNGDAEMVHVLDFRAGQCRVVQHGPLQGHAVREKVCQVMEGGEEAFERRYMRLGTNRT
ncbi:MAG: AAA family ATPase [Nannocystaceae bacterium]